MPMIIDEVLKAKILAGRNAVDAYRIAHTQLYKNGWYKDIPEEHTPLLNQLISGLNELGITSVKDFFDASYKLKDGWK